MTTPTRIATFLFQSALCLGLAAGPVMASSAETKLPGDGHTLTREREGVDRVSDKVAVVDKASESQAEPEQPATAAPAQAARDAEPAR